MTKEIMLKIKGMQKYPTGEKEENVTEVPAEYFLRNNSHYVQFEECMEGFTASSKCLLKLKGDCVELTKKGLVQSHMVFEEGKLHMTEYRTPFGLMMLGVKTKRVQILQEVDVLAITIEYSLEAAESHMADCKIQMMVKSRE